MSDGKTVDATSAGLPRRISVEGMEGIAATVVVRVVRGTVWMSIFPGSKSR
ncbi:MAG: hypothetical protein ACRDRX_28385 [Pseudonocardiaceae bacterium]